MLIRREKSIVIEVYYAEDDEIIAKSVKEYLEQQNCKVTVFGAIVDIKKALINHLPTVILLDWNMPDGQGNELCRWIRDRWNDLPVIYLTVRGDSCDIVSGFQNGADDYVVKPFSPKELMARINVILSRKNAGSASAQGVMKFGGLEINIPARTVTVDGQKVDLTPKEYDLLFYLVENRNIALSRDKLLSDIWGYDFFGDDRTIDTHIKNLRNNLGPYRDYIVTLRGVGYKFEYEG